MEIIQSNGENGSNDYSITTQDLSTEKDGEEIFKIEVEEIKSNHLEEKNKDEMVEKEIKSKPIKEMKLNAKEEKNLNVEDMKSKTLKEEGNKSKDSKPKENNKPKDEKSKGKDEKVKNEKVQEELYDDTRVLYVSGWVGSLEELKAKFSTFSKVYGAFYTNGKKGGDKYTLLTMENSPGTDRAIAALHDTVMEGSDVRLTVKKSNINVNTEANWKCTNCNYVNFSQRPACRCCKGSRESNSPPDFNKKVKYEVRKGIELLVINWPLQLPELEIKFLEFGTILNTKTCEKKGGYHTYLIEMQNFNFANLAIKNLHKTKPTKFYSNLFMDVSFADYICTNPKCNAKNLGSSDKCTKCNKARIEDFTNTVPPETNKDSKTVVEKENDKNKGRENGISERDRKRRSRSRSALESRVRRRSPSYERRGAIVRPRTLRSRSRDRRRSPSPVIRERKRSISPVIRRKRSPSPLISRKDRRRSRSPVDIYSRRRSLSPVDVYSSRLLDSRSLERNNRLMDQPFARERRSPSRAPPIKEKVTTLFIDGWLDTIDELRRIVSKYGVILQLTPTTSRTAFYATMSHIDADNVIYYLHSTNIRGSKLFIGLLNENIY